MNPFVFFDLVELRKRPPKQYLVEGWFGKGDLFMIFGDSGTGKSFLIADIAVRAAKGLPIAGRFKVSRPLRVVYCYEEGADGVPDRFKAACERHGLGPTDPENDNIRFCECVPKLFQDPASDEGLEA